VLALLHYSVLESGSKQLFSHFLSLGIHTPETTLVPNLQIGVMTSELSCLIRQWYLNGENSCTG